MPNKTTTACAARTNALVCNIPELIAELEERIEDGELFDNPKLTKTPTAQCLSYVAFLVMWRPVPNCYE